MKLVNGSLKKLPALIVILCILVVILVAQIVLLGNRSLFSLAQNNNDLNVAHQAFNNNDFKSGLSIVNQILSNDPHNAEALVTKALLLAQEGSIEFKEQFYGSQAIDAAQEALTIDPQNDEAWRAIGYANEIMQNYKAAHDAYKESLMINPRNVLTISQEAHAYDLEGDMKKAESGYRNALAINPGAAQAKMGLARVALRNGDSEAALALFSDLSRNAPSLRMRAGAAYSAGSIAEASGDIDQAAHYMDLAKSLDDSYALAWVGLGKVAFDRAMSTSTTLSEGDRSELINSSVFSLQKATTLNPNQSVAYYQLAVEMVALKQSDTARSILTELLTIIPNDITLSASEKQIMNTNTKALLAFIKK